MNPELAEPLAAYYEGNRRFDLDAMLAPFAERAVVRDERRTHEGREEIRAWIETATITQQALATPISVKGSPPRQVVTAEVSGPFPGSPVTLEFRFTLEGGHIAALEIA